MDSFTSKSTETRHLLHFSGWRPPRLPLTVAPEYPFPSLWLLSLHLSLLVCFMLSFPRLPFEVDILVTLILPRAAFFLSLSFLATIWKYMRRLYWTAWIFSHSYQIRGAKPSIYISLSKKDKKPTKSNYFCFGRSLLFSGPSYPLSLQRGPGEDRLTLAEKSHQQTLMISWLKCILRKRLWGKVWFGNLESAQKSGDHS